MIRFKQMMISVALILFVLLVSVYADNQQNKSWAINLVSVETPKSILNYMPSDKGSAVSQGDSPLFSKFSEPEQKAASGVTITLAPGQKEQLTFLLGSKPTGLSFNYSFLEGNWKEIK